MQSKEALLQRRKVATCSAKKRKLMSTEDAQFLKLAHYDKATICLKRSHAQSRGRVLSKLAKIRQSFIYHA